MTPEAEPAPDQRPDAFLTAVSVLDSLIRAGMRHAVIAPGSRSAPLAYALAAAADAGALQVHVRIDERTAGFTALGLAKATGAPVAVVTTSGTAVGELLPAVMEAHHAEVPLAVLSADRPPRLRGTGANQTTDQPGIFGTHVRVGVDLTDYPEQTPGPQTAGFTDALAALTGRDPEDWAQPSLRPRGPVQINCAFDEPLHPDRRMRQILRAWADGVTGLEPEPAPTLPDPTLEAVLADAPRPPADGIPRRSVVIAGDGAGPLAREFAEAQGLPLLAEPSSNARSGTHAIGAYRVLLGEESLGGRIERVVLFGRPTLSRPVTRLLADPQTDAVIYLPRPVAWADPRRRPEMPVRTLAEAAAFAGTGEPGWLQAWRDADAALAARIDRLAAAGQRLTGPAVAAAVTRACARDGSALVLGSSNLVRDADLAPAPDRALTGVWANRGLAGIDGTAATATGIGLGLDVPVRLLVGDLTFLHDLGSLNLGPREARPRLQIVVFNDDGGGIFTTLEHGQVAEDQGWADAVERFFSTPHGADLEQLVRGFGHRYTRADDVAALRATLREPEEGIEVIEVRGSRADLRPFHDALARPA
ncbi:2-succinyl-5-enolpyruvyl-6-hydroxy-3-cyclohexene-1-carboxylic-acid synthase [Rothia kristinae]|uniref:2-succinyl-5-enolpyruvyl-6-hydroxy-3- cyclohexene-1-carboxylic-acid synthase n=1 Tax=Rothia kristinae TaxID=37923 RepID=UPI0021B54298|nr:2-succinyl-5-enolpyruvyl-6-hydroxy-3-cyclohexene-1-carboxylic-acid synthase [Rothia kristinae]